MPHVEIEAVLPFPLRVDPARYTVAVASETWAITVSRVQRTHFDERILGGGENIDLRYDREGQASYSRVVASCDVSEESIVRQPLDWQFAEALNFLIAHVRDLFGVHWIRQLEPVDFLMYSETVPGRVPTTRHGLARSGGVRVATVGLQPAAQARLLTALASGNLPPVWRTLQLDALEALRTGRYNEAVILIWSALESGVRSALPGLAYGVGLRIGELDERLNVPRRARQPSLSLEESVERGTIERIIRTVAELRPGAYDAASISRSVMGTARLRNRIVHQGVQIGGQEASREFDGIRFYLEQVPLRDVAPPPPEHSWIARYGSISPSLLRFLEDHELRIVLANSNQSGIITDWWDPERLARDLWIRVDPAIEAEVVEALAITNVEAWESARASSRARLHVSEEATEFLIAGMLHAQASRVEFCVARSMALRRTRPTAIAVEKTARYFVSRLVSEVVASNLVFQPDDVRSVSLAVELACFLAALPPDALQAELQALGARNDGLRRRAVLWATHLRAIDEDDPHTVCDALRAIHDSTPFPWLDSIVVVCPQEGAIYGSVRRDAGSIVSSLGSSSTRPAPIHRTEAAAFPPGPHAPPAPTGPLAAASDLSTA